jgi:hypothetical protein
MTEAEADCGALVLAAIRRDEQGLAAMLARLLACAVGYCGEAAAELAA